MKVFLYVLLQCTWGILQTGAGFFLCLWCRRCPRHIYRGAVHTEWEKSSGISLGPFYLIVIGLPSLVWGRSKRLDLLRREKGLPYSFLYTEGWADRLGEWATGERSSGG